MTSEIIELIPSDIRFMHDKIHYKFYRRLTLDETITRIENGQMSVYDLPKIKVVKRNNYWYSFDNRRLYLYRVLEYRKKLFTIKVRQASLSDWQPSRFSTKNNGKSVVVKNGTTLPHSTHADSPPASPQILTLETNTEVENDSVASGDVQEVNAATANEDNNFHIGHENIEEVEKSGGGVKLPCVSSDHTDNIGQIDTATDKLADNDLDKVIAGITDPQEDRIEDNDSNISGNIDEDSKNTVTVTEISDGSANDSDADDNDSPSKPKKRKYDTDIIEQSYRECFNSAEKSFTFESDVEVDNNIVEFVNEDVGVEHDNLVGSLETSESVDPLKDESKITITAIETEYKSDGQGLTEKCDQSAFSNTTKVE